MRTVDLTRPIPSGADPRRVAWLTGHLKARLLDFGPGGPEVVSADPAAGRVTARFPGLEPAAAAARLAEKGISLLTENDCALFCLHPDVRFEDLDYVWGCLFEIL